MIREYKLVCEGLSQVTSKKEVALNKIHVYYLLAIKQQEQKCILFSRIIFYDSFTRT